MFKDAAKGLCKQQSQDGAPENVTVSTTSKLEQVTGRSFLKCLLGLRSGNGKLNEAEDCSIFFPSPPHRNIICTVEPRLLDLSLQSVWSCTKFPLCELTSCQLLVAGQGLRQLGGSEPLRLFSRLTTGEGQLLALAKGCSCLQPGFTKERSTTWETAI